MATAITQTTMTLEELAAWLGNRKEKARLRLTNMYIDETDTREVCVQSGQVGYYLRKSWVRIRPGDIVKFKKGIDVEIE